MKEGIQAIGYPLLCSKNICHISLKSKVWSAIGYCSPAVHCSPDFFNRELPFPSGLFL